MAGENEAEGSEVDISAPADDPMLKAAQVEKTTQHAPTDISESARKAACRAFESRTRSKYVSAMFVHHFHRLLVVLNAPLDTRKTAMTMLEQEQEHAAMCMAAAQSFGAEAELAFDLFELQLLRCSAPLEDQHQHVQSTLCCMRSGDPSFASPYDSRSSRTLLREPPQVYSHR